MMPFGFTNAPATFQSTMNKIFQPFLRKFMPVFFDDILVYSNTLETHDQHLKTVLETLQTHQLFAKLSKCDFCKASVHYLGLVISTASVQVDNQKIEAIMNWPSPQNMRQLRGFLGPLGYYRHFVKNYASLAWPLIELLKLKPFEWNSEANLAFQKLKTALTATLVLKLPDFSELFVIETDASTHGVGAVYPKRDIPWLILARN